jgi:DNA-binding MarR family transcriptional regulator
MSVQALSSAFAARGLSPSEKLVLLALANYADASQRCFPSHATIAADTGLSDRTILTVLKSLEDGGLLTRQQRRREDGSRSSDLITLTFGGGEMVSPRGENDRQTKPQLTAVGGETVSPHEPRTNHQIEEPTSEASASAQPNPDQEAWREGVVVLVSQGGMSVQQAKAFFGGLLKQNRIEARSLLGAIGECKANATQDPKSYLAAAARARAKRRDEPQAQKRVSWV